ncbi:hypothetical protein Tco_1252336 [Tanacetum coccineum]
MGYNWPDMQEKLRDIVASHWRSPWALKECYVIKQIQASSGSQRAHHYARRDCYCIIAIPCFRSINLGFTKKVLHYGKLDRANILTIVRMLKCFFFASGLQINILKSKLMGIGVSNEEVLAAANIIGCSTFSTPFSYLGVKVGMSPC